VELTTAAFILGNHRYFCESCNRFTEATRKLLLMTLPEVLVLHLNRSSGGTRKVGSHVQAPQHLDLTRWAKKSEPGRSKSRYELSAIIFHSGQSSLSGHYTFYARTPIPGDPHGTTAWAFFDDETVEFVTDDYIHGLLAPFSKSRATAYILFYQSLS
jgi:ubiquitin C-terminal hydrolase